MESSVDLPQPDGPAIETYSPFLMSMWMPDNAWVSTSSVRKTFVTPSSLMRESDMGVGVGLGDGGWDEKSGARGQVSERSASVATSTTREVRMITSGITGAGSRRYIAGAGESGGGGEKLRTRRQRESYRSVQFNLMRSLASYGDMS